MLFMSVFKKKSTDSYFVWKKPIQAFVTWIPIPSRCNLLSCLPSLHSLNSNTLAVLLIFWIVCQGGHGHAPTMSTNA